ncbi:MAG: LysM peptidoglycan-binding domain-containing protein [Bacteriovoracaceae bacterium]
MKKEITKLILLALLLNPTFVGAQEELSDEDLQSLLNGAEATTTELSETAPAESSTQPSAATPTPTEEQPSPEAAPADQSLSSETVDLGALENTETTAAPVESTEATVIEPLPATPEEKPEPAPVPEVAQPVTPEASSSNDELEALKTDVEEGPSTEAIPAPAPVQVENVKPEEAAPATETAKVEEPSIFDVGVEEKNLMALAQNIQGQISDNEWNEVATAAKADSYTVVRNDWLFKISKKLFGSGFYYPKIWSLNPYITNPHFIEPGMVLSFTTGSANAAPEFKLGTFSPDELNTSPGSTGNENPEDLANFGEEAKPEWLNQKKKLEDQGIYFQYASEETMDDLSKASKQALNRDYENYEPPRNELEVVLPKNYDKNGFDKTSRVFYSFKEGFYLSTFISTNIVQDFGSIENGPDENIFFTKTDRAYVTFDESVNALPGDKFSVYSTGGKVKHEHSDREGFKYSIVAQIKLIRKIKDKWEVEFIEVSGTPQRGDRITAYTPKIERITRTYNSRLVESAIVGTYQPGQSILGFGDVIYIDRGRADGVELGNVFEVYGFKDRFNKRNITDQPTYKTGELTVITLTDNFATALVTNSTRDFYAGDICITKTKESHLREENAKDAKVRGEKEMVNGKALEELDVELNLDNLNDDLLKKADKIKMTEDELAELERQEREKSVIKDSERDLKSLERLESEIESAEKILNDAKLDEDKLLENQNLNEVEKKQNTPDQDSLDEIEENLGKRYMDEDLNSKENPYGLTEFDVEEVDELLNVEKKQ